MDTEQTDGVQNPVGETLDTAQTTTIGGGGNVIIDAYEGAINGLSDTFTAVDNLGKAVGDYFK